MTIEVQSEVENHGFEVMQEPSMVEKNSSESQWTCWSLTKGDIDDVAEALEYSPRLFEKKDYERIAKLFAEQVEIQLDNWEELLASALAEAMRVEE